MKHRVKGKKLNRSRKHRKSLKNNLSLGLLEHGHIKTTEAKAKMLKQIIDKLINTGKKNNVATRRQIAQTFGKRAIANYIVDVVSPQYKDKTGGFTKTTRLGKRKGDDTMMVRIELIDFKKPEIKKEEKSAGKTSKAKPTKKTSSAKSKTAKSTIDKKQKKEVK